MKDLKSFIVDYLEEVKLMQLATAAGNQPWVCSVWFAADDRLNIYWFSSNTRRHSNELKGNNKVAGVFTLPHTPADPPRGLQFEGTAEELTDTPSIQRARIAYLGRIFDEKTVDGLINNPEKPHCFYRAQPSKFVLFDTVNFPGESRQEYEVRK